MSPVTLPGSAFVILNEVKDLVFRHTGECSYCVICARVRSLLGAQKSLPHVLETKIPRFTRNDNLNTRLARKVENGKLKVEKTTGKPANSQPCRAPQLPPATLPGLAIVTRNPAGPCNCHPQPCQAPQLSLVTLPGSAFVILNEVKDLVFRHTGECSYCVICARVRSLLGAQKSLPHVLETKIPRFTRNDNLNTRLARKVENGKLKVEKTTGKPANSQPCRAPQLPPATLPGSAIVTRNPAGPCNCHP